jgi:hypothetical protein
METELDASRESGGLEQWNRDFATYLAEFKQSTAGQGKDEGAKMAALLRGLSAELAGALLEYEEQLKTFGAADSGCANTTSASPHSPFLFHAILYFLEAGDKMVEGFICSSYWSRAPASSALSPCNRAAICAPSSFH